MFQVKIRLAPLVVLLACACAVLGKQATAADEPATGANGNNNAEPSENWNVWNQAEIVFVGELTSFKAGPTAMSMPPIYSNQLTLKVVKVFRGALTDAAVSCSHSVHALNNYPYEAGKQYIVALSTARDSRTVQFLVPAEKAAIAEAQMACALPLGWKLESGKPVSPWAALGDKAWSANLPADVAQPKYMCARTGRPALLAGDATDLDVAAAPPPKSIEWTNPDGDGEYKITVSNPTDKPIVVPALLTQGGKILWKESLVILCQGKAYRCPGGNRVTGAVAPLTLKPGENVTTVINVLALTGPDWPQGGDRIEFTFCLGEKSRTMSFYYLSRYHDKLRDDAHKYDNAG